MKIHSSISTQAILDQCEADDNSGFCIACGEEAYNVEPDARNYECESCGQNQVFGCEELLLMIG